jgi:CheY-like chemotaxis protein
MGACPSEAVAYNPSRSNQGGQRLYEIGSRRDRNLAKSVLVIGNCSYDHGQLRAAIREHFDAEVQAASHADEAMRLLTEECFDLVLVNRVLEVDRSLGIDLIRRIKGTPQLGNPAVMLVSNFSDAQEQAVEAGAEPGFGKKALNAPETIARLRPHLS